MPRSIDLNADVGEGIADDAAIIRLVSSANIACGAHAGDADTMRRCVRTAVEHGVAIGAHPGHEDPANFGRVAVPLSEASTHELVFKQIARLSAAAVEHGASVAYVKPHGALYHQANTDDVIAGGIVSAVSAWEGDLAVLGQAGSRLAHHAREAGLRFYNEGFADRAYEPSGSLTPRSEADALLHGAEVIAQALSIAKEGTTRARDGSIIGVPSDSLCLHGDTHGAVENARTIRDALQQTGVVVQAFSA